MFTFSAKKLQKVNEKVIFSHETKKSPWGQLTSTFTNITNRTIRIRSDISVYKYHNLLKQMAKSAYSRCTNILYNILDVLEISIIVPHVSTQNVNKWNYVRIFRKMYKVIGNIIFSRETNTTHVVCSLPLSLISQTEQSACVPTYRCINIKISSNKSQIPHTVGPSAHFVKYLK